MALLGLRRPLQAEDPDEAIVEVDGSYSVPTLAGGCDQVVAERGGKVHHQQ